MSPLRLESLLVLLLHRVELGIVYANRVLDTCQCVDTSQNDGDQDKEGDKQGENETRGQELITLKDTTIRERSAVVRCRLRVVLTGVKGVRIWSTGIDNEVVGENEGECFKVS